MALGGRQIAQFLSHLQQCDSRVLLRIVASLASLAALLLWVDVLDHLVHSTNVAVQIGSVRLRYLTRDLLQVVLLLLLATEQGAQVVGVRLLGQPILRHYRQFSGESIQLGIFHNSWSLDWHVFDVNLVLDTCTRAFRATADTVDGEFGDCDFGIDFGLLDRLLDRFTLVAAVALRRWLVVLAVVIVVLLVFFEWIAGNVVVVLF